MAPDLVEGTVAMADVIRAVIPDEPGALAKLTMILAERGVQVDGVNLLPKGREGEAQFLVRNGDKALEVIQETGFSAESEDVQVLTLSNDRTALADVCQRLAKAGINIEGCFGTTYGQQGTFVLMTDDNAAAREVLDQVA
jgi:hypothetical protein